MAMILQFQEFSILQSILQRIDAWLVFAPPDMCVDVEESARIAQI